MWHLLRLDGEASLVDQTEDTYRLVGLREDLHPGRSMDSVRRNLRARALAEFDERQD